MLPINTLRHAFRVKTNDNISAAILVHHFCQTKWRAHSLFCDFPNFFCPCNNLLAMNTVRFKLWEAYSFFIFNKIIEIVDILNGSKATVLFFVETIHRTEFSSEEFHSRIVNLVFFIRIRP